MKHLALLHSHVKQHHKKYLFGICWSFAIIKTILLFVGLFWLIHIVNIFAIGTATNVSITGASLVGQTLTGSYTYVDVSWETVGTKLFSSGQTNFSKIFVYSGVPYVAYQDTTNGRKTTVMKFNGTWWEVVGTPGFSSGNAGSQSLYVYSGIPYVAYADNSSWATVMKFNGTWWEVVWTPKFSSGQADQTSLFIESGIVYVAYRDAYNGNKTTVMKFNGTSREAVGTPGFSTGSSNSPSLYVYSGIPYVAYADNSSWATVMKFNGTSREAVGTPGLSSSGQVDYTKIFIYSGVPYIAYSDYIDDIGKTTVMKFNGTGREAVGTPRFSSGDAGYTSLFVYSGTPYVSYLDAAYEWKATLMKFNGTSREAVGTPGFSEGQIGYISLFVYNEIPYVNFADYSSGGKATVMRYRPDVEGISTYQWYRNDVAITWATGLLYSVATGDAGTTLNFEVTPVSSGWRAGLPVSSADKYIPAPSAESVTITGTLSINEILTGSYTYIDNTSGGLDPEGTSHYQWYRNDVAITGATEITYSVGTGDAGTTIKFEVTPISIAWGAWSPVKSSWVTINHVPTATNVMITGTPNTGEILTGSYTYSDIDVSWETLGSPRFSDGESAYPSLYIYSWTIYLAYVDWSDAGQATVVKFNGTSREAVGSPRFSDGQVYYTSLFIESGIVYVAYSDYSGNGEATVMKFNGTSRENVGSPRFSDGESAYTSLYVYSGVPYIAFADYSSGGKATVMKFNGTAWEPVGTKAFSDGPIEYTSLFIDNGVPYVAYSDGYDEWQATVMKFNGTDREAVGTPRFSAWRAGYTSLYIYDATLYIAYSDISDAGQATVMKFNGTSREAVGTPKFSNGQVYYTSLFIESGIVYVAYSDYSGNGEATVMKFNGTSREAFGTPKFSEWWANYTSLFVYNGTPYVAYSDWADNGQTTVMKGLSDLEGTSLYQRYRNDAAILWATGLTYILITGDEGTTIKFEVTPVALSWSSPGIAVQSSGLLINGGQWGGGDIGWWGWGILPKDVCTPERDCSSSYYDHICGPCSSTGEVNDTDNSCNSYSDELNGAYLFAYENGITTIKNCIAAGLDGNLIRSHMAKMVSQFAIKVLKMKPDTKKTSCTFPDMNNESKEMQFYATIACQLGLMGLDTDGTTPKATFDPNDTVDRAQFWTILSRILRGTKYAGELPFYVKHLNALKKNAIMNDITRPLAPEMRGRVMLMLQRSAEWKKQYHK